MTLLTVFAGITVLSWLIGVLLVGLMVAAEAFDWYRIADIAAKIASIAGMVFIVFGVLTLITGQLASVFR